MDTIPPIRQADVLHDVLGEERFDVVAHDWGGPVAFALAAQHREAVRAMAIFDAPVPGDDSPLNGIPRWHYGFHGKPDLPEALVAGREEARASAAASNCLKLQSWGGCTSLSKTFCPDFRYVRKLRMIASAFPRPTTLAAWT